MMGTAKTRVVGTLLVCVSVIFFIIIQGDSNHPSEWESGSLGKERKESKESKKSKKESNKSSISGMVFSPEAFDSAIQERNAITVDVDEVREQAALIERPYSSEKEKAAVLNKLGKSKVEFIAMIGTSESVIDQAIRDGSRTEAEINEAQEALNEMKKGKAFIESRIDMVENEQFE
ncbi:MAG: hypothetical protein GY754_20350 [bacterium]|nr:hypothetical protein [bacterium]